MNLMVYALVLEASTRYFDVLYFLFEHFMPIFTMSDFFFVPLTINMIRWPLWFKQLVSFRIKKYYRLIKMYLKHYFHSWMCQVADLEMSALHHHGLYIYDCCRLPLGNMPLKWWVMHYKVALKRLKHPLYNISKN